MLLELMLLAQVVVSWDYVPGAEIQEQSFEVERAPSGCAQWELIARPAADVMSIEDIDVPGNCYRVRAVDAKGKRYEYSSAAVVPPKPVQGPKVVITAPSNRTADRVVTRRKGNTATTVPVTVNLDDCVYFNGKLLSGGKNCAANP